MKLRTYAITATLIMLSLTVKSFEAHASGCGSYDYTRGVAENILVSHWPDDEFNITSKTDSAITVQVKATGQQIVLDWEKSELYEDKFDNYRTEKRDLLFEEGNGCGPIFRCVTGQVRIIVYNSKMHRSDTFAFPVVNEMYSSHEMRYASEALLPVWGNLKLDVPSILNSGSSETYPIDRAQCGYGNW